MNKLIAFLRTTTTTTCIGGPLCGAVR